MSLDCLTTRPRRLAPTLWVCVFHATATYFCVNHTFFFAAEICMSALSCRPGLPIPIDPRLGASIARLRRCVALGYCIRRLNDKSTSARCPRQWGRTDKYFYFILPFQTLHFNILHSHGEHDSRNSLYNVGVRLPKV